MFATLRNDEKLLTQHFFLAGSPENLQSLLTMVGQDYVGPVKSAMEGKEKVVMEEPILLPDKAIWHPVAPDIVFETNNLDTLFHEMLEFIP